MNWMKHKNKYFSLSGVLLLLSLFSLFMWGLKLGIDFTGGSIIEYQFSKNVGDLKINEIFKEIGVDQISLSEIDGNKVEIRSLPLSHEDKSKLDELLIKADNGVNELKYEVVGPAIGPELIRKTIYALILSAFVILLWIAYQFKNMRFGVSAILAMLHDSIILLGSFSILGHFGGVEVDFLFVTAMLTILSFSVHDTIVVFDRIREVTKKSGSSIREVADTAVTQTMVRSMNNSFTIIFMLVALVLIGGVTIKWFAVALLIGTISGTYSSPFVAVPLLYTFDGIKNIKINFKK